MKLWFGRARREWELRSTPWNPPHTSYFFLPSLSYSSRLGVTGTSAFPQRKHGSVLILPRVWGEPFQGSPKNLCCWLAFQFQLCVLLIGLWICFSGHQEHRGPSLFIHINWAKSTGMSTRLAEYNQGNSKLFSTCYTQGHFLPSSCVLVCYFKHIQPQKACSFKKKKKRQARIWGKRQNPPAPLSPIFIEFAWSQAPGKKCSTSLRVSVVGGASTEPLFPVPGGGGGGGGVSKTPPAALKAPDAAAHTC